MRRTILRMAVAVLLLATSASLAAGFQSFSRADQVRDCDVIALGRVESLLSYWNGPQSVIQTDARVAIEDVWKGDPGADRVTVRTLGGVVDRVSQEVDGAARFDVGERVVLFLRRHDGVYAPWGMRYGKYRVVGSSGETFALGVLPPRIPGEGRFRDGSIALGELRDEVADLLGAALGAAR